MNNKNILKKDLDIKNPQRVMLVFAIALSFFSFISFVYPDVAWTTRGGIELLNRLFGGNIRGFYSETEGIIISNSFGICDGFVYNIFLYVIFAIWNIPLFIYEKVTGLYALDCFPAILWAKSISLPFLYVTITNSYAIAKHIKKEINDYTVFNSVFFSSVLLFTPFLLMGQYDSIFVCFLILGIRGYIEEDDKRFLLFFALSMPIKLFSLFSFIPLLILQTKNVKEFLKKFFIGISFFLFTLILQKIIFVTGDYEKNFMEGTILSFVFQGRLNLTYSQSSIFIILFALLCLSLLFVNFDNDKKAIFSIWISFVSYSLFFVCCLTHPQWSMILLPLSVIAIMIQTDEASPFALLIETVMEIGLLIAQIGYYYWVFSRSVVTYLPLGKAVASEYEGGFTLFDMFSMIFPSIDSTAYMLFGGGVFVAAIIVFIYWAFPFRKNRTIRWNDISIKNICVFRVLVIAAVVAAMYMLAIC